MFDLANLKRVTWPVPLAQQDGEGNFVDAIIMVSFERLEGDALAAIQRDERAEMVRQISDILRDAKTSEPAGAKSAQLAETEKAIESADKNRVDTIVAQTKGWGDSIIDNGTPVPFGEEVLRTILSVKPWRDAFWQALRDCSERAKPKNSLPGPGGTPADPPK